MTTQQSIPDDLPFDDVPVPPAYLDQPVQIIPATGWDIVLLNRPGVHLAPGYSFVPVCGWALLGDGRIVGWTADGESTRLVPEMPGFCEYVRAGSHGDRRTLYAVLSHKLFDQAEAGDAVAGE